MARSRRLAAIYFADIVGFTPLASRDENESLRLIRLLQSIGQTEVDCVGGRVVKFLGDAVLAEFTSAEAAVRSALNLNLRFIEESEGASLRTGLAMGEVVFQDDGDVIGDTVNLAARLQTEAAPGQVLTGEDVFRQLRRLADFRFQMLGTRQLKGFSEPLATFALAFADDSTKTVAGDRKSRKPGEASDARGGRTRLVVLPFRILRPDSEIDFLGFSLPDAISSSLSELSSLIVRSPSTAAGTFSLRDGTDPRAIGRAVDVDVVLSGSILRHGDRLRVAAQLADAHDGTLLWSRSEEVTLDDLFRLQDELSTTIVESLRVPLSARERLSLAASVPASPAAYELYLRANEIAYQGRRWSDALDLYQQTIALDAEYAPAWARMARCYRLIGKYALSIEERDSNTRRAEDAFQRALQLSPELSVTHHLYAQFEVESGRAVHAMVRLMDRIRNKGPDADSFAGLVASLRYAGLFEESLAAAEQARQLNPTVPTSVAYTYFALRDFEAALREVSPSDGAYLEAMCLAARGEMDRARQLLHDFAVDNPHDAFGLYGRAALAVFDGEVQAAIDLLHPVVHVFQDPELSFAFARCLSWAGASVEAIGILETVVDAGYLCAPALREDPWLAGVRNQPSYIDLLDRVERRSSVARAEFERAGGSSMLGTPRLT